MDEIRMYWSAVLGLLAGREVFQPPVSASDIPSLKRLRGRRAQQYWELVRKELEAEHLGLEAVRARAQFMLTTEVALLGFALANVPTVTGPFNLAVSRGIWGANLVLFVVAALGATSVVVARKKLGVVLAKSAARLSHRELAKQGLWAIETSRTTKNASITVFRDSVLLALLGCVLMALVFLANNHALDWSVFLTPSRSKGT